MRLDTIDTEYGAAVLYYDERGDPGWVLRYHLEPEDSEDALGRRHLDEPLTAADPDDVQSAETEAREFLGRQKVRHGARLTTEQAAELAGVTPVRWRGIAAEDPEGRGPDGRHDSRTPWWWESSVSSIIAARPGRGARTDLRRNSEETR